MVGKARGSLKTVGGNVRQAGKKGVKRTSNKAAAKQALEHDLPDIGDALHQSGFQKQISRLKTSVERAIAGEGVLQAISDMQIGIAKLGLKLSTRDLAIIMRKALQLRTSSGGRKFVLTAALKQGVEEAARITKGYRGQLSGEIFERVVRHVPSIRQSVDALLEEARIRAKAVGGKTIDTIHVGEVRLTGIAKTGDKPPLENLLGPDRLIGYIKRDKKAIADEFAGTIHVTSIIEVKSLFGGEAGRQQLQAFFARASHGKVTIGTKTYRIEVDETLLKRILILPDGAPNLKSLEAAATANGIEVLKVPHNIANAVKSATDQVIGTMQTLDNLLR